MDKKSSHSKMDNLNYPELKIQPYLISSLLRRDQAQQLFKFRTRMANVKGNFKNGQTDYFCPVCVKIGVYEDDYQKHLLSCVVLKQKHNFDVANYENIFQAIFLTLISLGYFEVS